MPEPFRLTAWRAPKAGSPREECEDRYAYDAKRHLFAIADGATESSFSGQWAGLLVKRFVAEPAVLKSGQWETWLPPLQERWRGQVGVRDMPWYAQAKAEKGAYAAFLGLAINNEHWRAVAVGDCCLFQLRSGKPMRAFPIGRSEDFGSRPWLIGTGTPPADIAGLGKERRCQADWEEGDRFLLMTDALAKWFLQRCEEKEDPEALADLLSLGKDEFNGQIEVQRQCGRLQDDDVTMLQIIPAKKQPGPPPSEEGPSDGVAGVS